MGNVNLHEQIESEARAVQARCVDFVSRRPVQVLTRESPVIGSSDRMARDHLQLDKRNLHRVGDKVVIVLSSVCHVVLSDNTFSLTKTPTGVSR